MAKYKVSGDGFLDTEKGMFIPNDEGNRHYQEMQAWIGEGNTVDPEFTAQEITDNAWASLRGTRDRLLVNTDFMVLQDVYSNYTAQQQTDITTYRQALRDLPGNTVDPTSPTWPTKPQVVIDAVGE